MNDSFTSPVTYDVVVDGTLHPGHNAEDAVADLVRRFGLPEATATDLLRGGREVVKKGLDQQKSKTYVEALRRCGVVARAERTSDAPPQRTHGVDHTPMAVDYGAAYVSPQPTVRHPPPSHPIGHIESRPRGSSLTVVGWSFLIAVPFTLLLLAFGDGLGRLAMFGAVSGIIAMLICNVWMLSVISQEGSGLWAVTALFFWPASLLFIITRWHAARAPFLVGLAATLVWASGFSALENLGTVECGSPGSFSYDDGDGCVCEDGYDWCEGGDNDMSCCQM